MDTLLRLVSWVVWMLFEMTLFFTSFFVHLVPLVMNCRPPLVSLASPGVFLPITFVSSTCCIKCVARAALNASYCTCMSSGVPSCCSLYSWEQIFPAVWNSPSAPDLNSCFITLGRKEFIINPKNCLPVNGLFIIFNILKDQTELKYNWSYCGSEREWS